jgi:hypothetical protein
VADDRRELEVALLEKAFAGLIYFVATQLPLQPQPRLDEPQGGEEVRVRICTTCDCLVKVTGKFVIRNPQILPILCYQGEERLNDN